MENVRKKDTLTKESITFKKKKKAKYFFGRNLNIAYYVLSPCYQLALTVVCGTVLLRFYPVMKTNRLDEKKKYIVQLSGIK